MSFGDASFELTGAVRSYDDVGAIVTAARSVGWNVSTPQARKDAAGAWGFLVRGDRPAAPAAPQPSPLASQ